MNIYSNNRNHKENAVTFVYRTTKQAVDYEQGLSGATFPGTANTAVLCLNEK